MEKTNTRKMESHESPVHEQPAQAGLEKKPYETPELKRLGTVKGLIQGAHLLAFPDMHGVSW